MQANHDVTHQCQQYIPEDVIWAYLVQLASAVRTVHAANAACRSIRLSHILTTHLTVRVGSTGVVEVLEGDTRKNIRDAQRDDVTALGEVMLALTTRRIVDPAFGHSKFDPALPHWAHLIQQVALMYSRELHGVVFRMLTQPPSIFQLCDMLSGRAFDELEHSYTSNQLMLRHLSNELGSCQMLRVLLILCATFAGETNKLWSDQRSRNLLTLFFQFVFNQVDSRGSPVVNYGHVVACLNKLEVRSHERILLTSQDGRTVIVSSYCEIRGAIEDVTSIRGVSYHRFTQTN